MSQIDHQFVSECEAAAEKGVTEAQFELGLMYSTGHGKPEDLVQAHMWLNLAAHMGNEEARFLRSDVADMMSESQIAEAQRLARDWLDKHARVMH